jgi:anaerobic magnesium-protoporphyrin IX monomethyl ester cyclase
LANILFINNGVFENLGIEYISAFLKKNGHKVSLSVDPALFSDTFHNNSLLSSLFSFEKIILEDIYRKKPSLICFSVLTDTYAWALKIAEKIKQAVDIPIIFGGIHPTLLPDLVISNKAVDMVCIAEGEAPLLELVNSLDRGNIDYSIQNIWFKKNGKIIKNSLRPTKKDLDSLPFPDKEIFYSISRNYAREYVTMTGRGCPFDCTYCSNHAIKKVYTEPYVRKRSVDNVITEIIEARQRYNMKYIWFMDDLFFLEKDWLRNFSQEYSNNIKIPFFCYVHPQQIDEEAAELLKRAGCNEVGVGVQTLSKRSKGMIKRFESEAEVRGALKIIKEKNMFVVTENIVGLPLEGEEDLSALAMLYNDIRPSIIIMNWLRLYPKTEILNAELLREEGAEQAIKAVNEGLNTQIGWQRNIPNEGLIERMVILIEASPFFPRSIVAVFINKKLYRFIPLWAKYISYLLRILRFSFLGKLIYRETVHDSGARVYVSNYLFFIFKRLLI